MTDDKENFHFQGKWFETFDEMIEYSNEWGNYRLDMFTATDLFSKMMKSLLLNVFLTSKPFTNKQFNNYLDKLFENAIFELHQFNESDHDR